MADPVTPTGNETTPPPPGLTEELRRVTGDQIANLWALGQARWFVLNPASLNTTAITADPIGYVALGKQYFGVSVDWAAVDAWERTVDLLDTVTAAMLTGVRGAEDVRTLDAFFDVLTLLANYLGARGQQLDRWVELVGSTGQGLDGGAASVVRETLIRYGTALGEWRAMLTTDRAVPLPTAVDLARTALRRFNTDVAESWESARGQGLRDRIRTAIGDEIIAIQTHLVSGGIVLGTPGYVLADWDPTAQSDLPASQADLDAFAARTEAHILAVLGSYPRGGLQDPAAWQAINQAVTDRVAPLITQLDLVAYERRVTVENAYTELAVGLNPTLKVPDTTVTIRDQVVDPNQDDGVAAPPDTSAQPGGSDAGAETPLFLVTTPGGGAPEVIAVGAGPGSDVPGGLGDQPGGGVDGTGFDGIEVVLPLVLSGPGAVAGLGGSRDDLATRVDLDVTANFAAPDDSVNAGIDLDSTDSTGVVGGVGGVGLLALTGLPRSGSGTDSDPPTVDAARTTPAAGTLGDQDSDGPPVVLPPFVTTVGVGTNQSGAGAGGRSAATEPAGASSPAAPPGSGSAGNAPAPFPRTGATTTVPSLGPTGPATPTGGAAGLPGVGAAAGFAAPVGWDGRIGGPGGPGPVPPSGPTVLHGSPGSGYQSPGFWPTGQYGSSPSQLAGSPAAFGRATGPLGAAGGLGLAGRSGRSGFRGRAELIRTLGRHGMPADPPAARLGPVDALFGPADARPGHGGTRPGKSGRDQSSGEHDDSWLPAWPGRRSDGVVGPIDDEETPENFAPVAGLGTVLLLGTARRRAEDEDDDEYRDQSRRGRANGVIDGSE
ncbi:hypothetical protein ACN27F_02825 [Solwaraspora sp. WMMB335]|uniref:hypothetical protein n=1 Tax=Solwaraspora sp. WMMB335 TaxID=3404118 RepID=UPI003B9446C1